MGFIKLKLKSKRYFYYLKDRAKVLWYLRFYYFLVILIYCHYPKKKQREIKTKTRLIII